MLLVNGKRKDNLTRLNKAVEFELLSGFTMENHKVKDSKGNPAIKKNNRYMLPSVYVRFDEGLNQNVEYRYAVQEIPIQTGKDAGTKKYAPNKLSFLSTKLVVTKDHPDLYEWLVNSPYIDNGKNKDPKFKEVNPVEKAKSRIEKEALRNKAFQLIVGDEPLPEITLRRILSSTGDNGDSYDIEIVKERLLAVAEASPSEFIKMIGTRDTELKALINDVVTKSYVTFNKEKSEWQWGEKTKEYGSQIVSVPRGKNEVDWMIDTLLRDEGLLKVFKAVNKQSTETKAKDNDRMAIEAKAKILRCAQGMHFLADEKLKDKVKQAEEKLTKEFENPSIKAERKEEIQGILSELSAVSENS